MTLPLQIVVWACPTCGYYRTDQSTGRHQVTNPEDPNGRMVTHVLERVTYVLPEVDTPSP